MCWRNSPLSSSLLKHCWLLYLQLSSWLQGHQQWLDMHGYTWVVHYVIPAWLVLVFAFLSDNDECALGTNHCSQNCRNTVGSYTCSCNAGYRLNADGQRCDGTVLPSGWVIPMWCTLFVADVDECTEGTDLCDHHQCLNTVGSYTCDCKVGYIHVTGLGCQGKLYLSHTLYTVLDVPLERPNHMSSLFLLLLLLFGGKDAIKTLLGQPTHNIEIMSKVINL